MVPPKQPKQEAPLDSHTPHNCADEETFGAQPDDAMAVSLNSADPLNRRKSVRCGIQPDQQPAILIKGWSRYPARLVDQSAGGYSVTYSGSAKFHVGQLLRMQTLAGLANVGVANVVREDDVTKIGLLRIEGVESRSNHSAAIACFLIVGIVSGLLFHFVL